MSIGIVDLGSVPQIPTIPVVSSQKVPELGGLCNRSCKCPIGRLVMSFIEHLMHCRVVQRLLPQQPSTIVPITMLAVRRKKRTTCETKWQKGRNKLPCKSVDGSAGWRRREAQRRSRAGGWLAKMKGEAQYGRHMDWEWWANSGRVGPGKVGEWDRFGVGPTESML